MPFVPDTPDKGRFIPDSPAQSDSYQEAQKRGLHPEIPGPSPEELLKLNPQHTEPTFSDRMGKIAGQGIEMAAAVPAIGAGAAALSKVPAIAKIPGIPQALKAMNPQSVKELLKSMGVAGVIGGSGEASRQTAEEMGAGPIGQTAAEITGTAGMAGAGGALAKASSGLGMPSIIKQLTGKAAKEATTAGQKFLRGETLQAESGAEKAAIKAESVAHREAQRAESADIQRSKIESRLADPKKTQWTLDEIGNNIRDSFNSAMTSAQQERSAAGKDLFAKTQEAAAKKEAIGSYVDTSEAETPLRQLLKESEGIPRLNGTVQEMLSAIRGPQSAPTKKPFTPWGPAPSVVSDTGKKPRTFEQLEFARRFLNDVGYGADLEGYTSTMRIAARDAAKAIEKAMAEHTPEHAKFKEEWKRLSEPLESMGTRLGKAIHATEGGIGQDAYSKVAAEDLPGKFFSKKENVDMLVDALSGGKSASPDKVADAEKTVQELAFKYLSEKTRQKSPEDVLKYLKSPQLSSMMGRLPAVEGKLTGQASRAAKTGEKAKALEEVGKGARKAAETAGKSAEQLRKSSTDFKEAIMRADTMAAQPGKDAHKQALDGYMKALTKARDEGLVSTDKYTTAIQMLSRAHSLEEKAALAERLAAVVGASVAGYEVYRGGMHIINFGGR